MRLGYSVCGTHSRADAWTRPGRRETETGECEHLPRRERRRIDQRACECGVQLQCTESREAQEADEGTQRAESTSGSSEHSSRRERAQCSTR